MKKARRTFPKNLAMFVIAFMATADVASEGTLGKFPLCEASAALLVNCPGGSGECLLVGDNELGKKLYLFPVKDQKLDADAQRALDLNLSDDDEISDIEALAGVSDDEIVALGSHSRNSKCEVKKKRRRFGKVSLLKEKTEVVNTLRSKEFTCEHLFGKRPVDPPMTAACEAIDTTELIASLIDDAGQAKKLTEDDAKASCNWVNAYNGEGAVALDTGKGTEVWIGLRAPLLPVHPFQPDKRHLAILLHMTALTTYTFDRVAFVDLGGRGVRDLSSDATSVWVIAGPPEDLNDRTEPFQLRRFPRQALNGGEVIDSELIQALPPSSEGLAVSGKTAYVVIDGQKGKSDCEKPARYEIVSLP